jgi:8-oxo-dGTP pyrophosphatase MutT (NUDIX family)
MSDAVPIRPAATVILVRDGAAGLETLLVRRSAELVFHGGSWVFPGGRIDDDDFVTTPTGVQGDAGDLEAAARIAAVREAREEAGLVVEPATLRPWAHWTTPPGRTRRFATWFYLAPAPHGSDDVVVDGSEISEHRWFRPADALEARRAGEIELPAPTFVSLLRLSSSPDVAGAFAHASAYPYLEFAPHPVKVEGGIVTIYNGDAAYDLTADSLAADALGETGIDTPGARHRLVMVGENWRYENTVTDR